MESSCVNDERFFDMVAEELNNGITVPGLRAKASLTQMGWKLMRKRFT